MEGIGAVKSEASDLPFVAIPRMAAPAVDGRLGDSEWQGAAQIGDFVLLDGSRLAREQTTCFLGHDEQALYFGCRMAAYALDPGSNQEHAFKDQLHGKQVPVWEDDSVEIRFSLPGAPNTVFPAAANTAR